MVEAMIGPWYQCLEFGVRSGVMVPADGAPLKPAQNLHCK